MYGVATLVAEAANFGVGYVLIRYFAALRELGPAVVRTGFSIVTSATIALVALLAAAGRILAGHAPVPNGSLTYMMLLVTALGTAWYVMTDNLLLATGRRRTLLMRAGAASVGRVVLLIALFFLGRLQWVSLLASYAVPQILASVAACIVSRPEILGGARRQILLGVGEIGPLAHYAWQSYLGNVVAAIVPNVLPVIVVWQIGAVGGAQFGAAWFVASLLMLVPTAISLTSFSAVARGEHHIDQIVSHSTWLMVVVQVPMTAAVLGLGPRVLPYLGHPYAHVGFWQLAPLLVGVLCVGFTSQIYSHARLIDGGLRLVLAAQTLQTVIVLSLAVLLASDFGLTGVFMAWLTGSGATFVITRLVGFWYLARIQDGVARRGIEVGSMSELVVESGAQ